MGSVLDLSSWDLADIVASLWRHAVPLEYVPDLAGWLTCVATSAWLVRFVLSWRPRLCLGAAGVWLTWFGWRIGMHGAEVWDATRRRGAFATEATERFVQSFVAVVQAWTDFFIPFFTDVCRWSLLAWRSLTVRQKLLLLFGSLSAYTVLEAFRFCQKHAKKIKQVIFHASFLFGGPLIWYLAGMLPSQWLAWTLSQVTTTVPTILSLIVLNQSAAAARAALNAALSRKRRSPSLLELRTAEDAVEVADGAPCAVLPSVADVEGERLWLCYWTCWPLLALLEVVPHAIRGGVPRILPFSSDMQQLQFDLRRALLTFVLWLQVWHGSKLLHFTLETLVRQTSFLEVIAGWFGQSGIKFLRVLGDGGIKATGGTSWGMVKFFAKLGSRGRTVITLSILGAIFGFAMIWVCFRVFSVLSVVLTLLLWFFAAADSADTLTKNAEDFYSRKIAFWVLAMIWEALTKLPVVGVVLRLFTPLAFSFWLIGGEFVLRRAVLPILAWFHQLLLRFVAKLVATCRIFRRRTEDEDASEEDEDVDALGSLAIDDEEGEEVTLVDEPTENSPTTALEGAELADKPMDYPHDAVEDGSGVQDEHGDVGRLDLSCNSHEDTGGTGGSENFCNIETAPGCDSVGTKPDPATTSQATVENDGQEVEQAPEDDIVEEEGPESVVVEEKGLEKDEEEQTPENVFVDEKVSENAAVEEKAPQDVVQKDEVSGQGVEEKTSEVQQAMPAKKSQSKEQKTRKRR
eukprot:TRINITY_DN23718_c0_g1_i1.p1 TRINITY_DN23718_c0_g1~~TRINITY_DN23718_c0_g1_i1.p1  ORF type:complete len:743 (-),score=167.15 TRINITY_DN23718_c0_g1_i1:76-2304(-)